MRATRTAASKLWVFSGRHTREKQLQSEIQRRFTNQVRCNDFYPGLTSVEGIPEWMQCGALDLVYALQVLPRCDTIHGKSITDLAKGASEVLSRRLEKIEADELHPGSLLMHNIVPGMAKGTLRPPQLRRSRLIQEKVSATLRSRWRCARKQNNSTRKGAHHLLAQLLLVEPEKLLVSLERVVHLPQGGTWPCLHSELGLATVAEEPEAPSSAYRKLSEVSSCCFSQRVPV